MCKLCNPCPCMSLQTGTKILALIDTIFSLLGLTVYIMAIVAISENPTGFKNSAGEPISEADMRKKRGGLVIDVCKCAVMLVLALLLYCGASNRNYSRCRLWLIIAGLPLFFTIFSILWGLFSVEVVSGSGSTPTTTTTPRPPAKDESYLEKIGGVIKYLGLYVVYEMIVVCAFLKELKEEGDA